MKLIVLSLLVSSIAVAEICDDKSQFGSLSEMAGTSCFNEDISNTDVSVFAPKADQMQELCQKCRNIPVELILKDEKAKEEKESAYGKFLFNELQKELSVVSVDLMRLRSSFSLDVDTKDISNACNIKEKLKKPSCLSKEQEKEFELQFKSLQNSLATELADIISNNQESKAGLFTKRKNSCGVEDSKALFSHMRYLETLISPELINFLQKQNISKKNPFDKEKARIISKSLTSDLEALEAHPLFSSLIQSPDKLAEFIADSSKITADKSVKDPSDKMVELLYSKKFSKNFGNKIKTKCGDVFSKTSKYLEDVYCKSTPSYIADDLEGMEKVSGIKFMNLDPKKAENEIRIQCAILNSKDPKAISIKKISDDIHSPIKDALNDQPISEFKSDAYYRMFSGVSENICNAKKANCAPDSKDQACVLLSFYNLTSSDKHFKQMASQSDDNINQILQALVGDGLPQKDGKVDQTAVVLLQKERILPGGASNEPAPKKATASEFHKTVRNSNGGESLSKYNSKITDVKPAEFKPGDTTSTPAPQMNPNMGFNSNRDDSDEESNSGSSQSAMRKAAKNVNGNGFSALSDAEQQDLLNRLKKGAKKKSTKALDQELEDSNSSYGEVNNQDNDGTFTASTENAPTPDNTRVAGQRFNDDRFSGKKAVIDPVKKVNSVNTALIDANKGRTPASSGSNLTSPVVSISKSGKDENEIKIQVDDQELSRVTEFKNKLKDLLAAHSQDLSVVEVGEKIVVKLNNYAIDVVYNKEKGFYEALTSDKDVPKDYLNTISYYFNVTLKEGKGKRESLVKTIQSTKK